MVREKQRKESGMKTADEVYNKLIETGCFTEDELQLVTAINGFSILTLNDCIYARYGYHSLEQMEGELEDDYSIC